MSVNELLLVAPDRDGTQQIAFAEQRDGENGMGIRPPADVTGGTSAAIGRISKNVQFMDGAAL